jgi:hypothetical protein
MPMPFLRSFPASTFADFKNRLHHRLKNLADEAGMSSFVMPVGLFLVIDSVNGGDKTAEETVRRFGILDFESKNNVDFYFLGWHRDAKKSSGIVFDIKKFTQCRDALKTVGIREFGGNADLILVDAVYESGSVILGFDEAIGLDLARAVNKKEILSVGGLLQSIIDAATQLKDDDEARQKYAFHISDKLGLAVARQSLLDWFLGRFGKIIGAPQLQAVCVRKLGPPVRLQDL